jgi:hypothetical protein
MAAAVPIAGNLFKWKIYNYVQRSKLDCLKKNRKIRYYV